MSEKDLFCKQTFIDLFNLNEIDRLEREDELFIEARKLGFEKRFKESLKKYEALFKNKINTDGGLDLPNCKYDIKNYNMASYTCNINGITDRTNFKFRRGN